MVYPSGLLESFHRRQQRPTKWHNHSSSLYYLLLWSTLPESPPSFTTINKQNHSADILFLWQTIRLNAIYDSMTRKRDRNQSLDIQLEYWKSICKIHNGHSRSQIPHDALYPTSPNLVYRLETCFESSSLSISPCIAIFYLPPNAIIYAHAHRQSSRQQSSQ